MLDELSDPLNPPAWFRAALGEGEPGILLYAEVIRNLPIAVTIWRLEDPADETTFRLVASNPAADRMAALPLGQRTGEPVLSLFPAAQATGILHMLQEVLRSEAPRDLGPIPYADERVSQAVFTLRAFPLADRCVGIVSEDVTQRHRGEEEARLLQAITLAVGEATDFRAALKVVLEKTCEATGWTLGQAWVPRADGTALEWCTASQVHGEAMMRFQHASESNPILPGAVLPGRVWSTKQLEWVEDVTRVPGFSRARAAIEAGLHAGVGVPVLAGGDVVAVIEFFLSQRRQEDRGLLGIVQTIAIQLGWLMQRKQSEERLRRSHERLLALSGRIQSIQEEERTTVAREIHDQLGQALTALKMETAWLHKRISEGFASRKDLTARLESMTRLVDSTIDQVRRISSKLRPGVLDQLGLTAAMEWQAEEFQKRTGVVCTVRSDLGETRLGRDASTALFRIFQECLTNVARHAKARWVRAVLRTVGRRLVLEVHDDGRGISPAEVASPASLGLLGMSERSRLMGGEFEISARAGGGTTARVTLPLKPHPARRRADDSRAGRR
jgi:signal transduction histidine kinase